MSATGQTLLDKMRAQASQLFLSGKFDAAASAYRGILDIVPSDFDAVHHMGQIAIQLGHLEEARKLLEAALRLKPDHADAWLHQGMALQHLGRTQEAVSSYNRAIGLNPENSVAMFCLAVTLKQAGLLPESLAAFNRFLGQRSDQPTAFLQRGDIHRQLGSVTAALADYETALTLNPDYLDAWMFRGTLLAEQGRSEEAVVCYDRAITLAPMRGDIWYNRGVALQDLNRNAEALAAYDRAVKFAPDTPNAWNNRGVLLRHAGKPDAALESFQEALKRDPGHVPSLNNQGAVLTDLRRFEEALASYDRALAAAPDQSAGWYNRGVALQDLGRPGEALAAYDKAVAIDPGSADAWNNRGNLLRESGKLEEAMASFNSALAINPGHAGTLANAGAGLQNLGRFDEAAREFRKLESVAPDHKYLLGGLAVSAMALCDWPALDRLKARLEAQAASGEAIVPPFTMLGLSSDSGLLQNVTAHYLRDLLGPVISVARPAPAPREKIRLAYISSDFYAHATARLMADLFERHDRSRFEVIAISFGPDEMSDMRTRLEKAFDRFHDVRALSDDQVADLLRDLQVDIAVDLKGYTQGARPGIFARRPAPVQVNYLGYPGTMTGDFMDYIIADPVALPLEQQPFYSEQIVHLPDSYQPNDPARMIGIVPTRDAAGLPPTGFVFCCFNNHWKITAPLFGCWMRLLQAVPGSVLWLLDDSGNANLIREAEKQGIDPARLIFAPKLTHGEHLGRLSLADLVLDTLPYNAHTTASDALWCGVPMITLRGEAFAGRVGASLLAAVGLPELITDDLAGYEALALSLGREPEKHQALKAKLAKNRLQAPLFDAARFCRNIEAAFIAMLDAARRG